MKLIKAIRLHRDLRVRQEVACYKVVKHSQDRFFDKSLPEVSPNLDELSYLNRAVRRVEGKLPSIYFLLSDLFGGASSIKKRALKELNVNSLSI